MLPRQFALEAFNIPLQPICIRPSKSTRIFTIPRDYHVVASVQVNAHERPIIFHLSHIILKSNRGKPFSFAVVPYDRLGYKQTLRFRKFTVTKNNISNADNRNFTLLVYGFLNAFVGC